MSGPFGSQQWMYATGAAEGQSLRFNDDDTAYLSWTPASAGNRKTWTWSGWVKRGNISSYQNLFWAGTDANNRTHFGFDNTDKLRFYHVVSANYEGVETLAVYRDVSSWYHIVFVLDTTLASSELDRAKIYVNGVLQATSQTFGGTITQNEELDVNSTQLHSIGDDRASSIPFDGYLAEVNFIDGQALDPTSFAETNTKGLWVPKTFAGTYGTNGFYLPFTNDYTVEGFNTVTYRGNGGTQYVGGVGFEPDLVWIKNRSGTNSHVLQDSVRGAGKSLFSNATSAESGNAGDLIGSFDTDGFTVNDTYLGGSGGGGTNGSGSFYVAWCWDAGTGSPVSNTDGSITSTVKANPTYGFSVVSYTGTGASATVGHGLSSAPELMLVKNRDAIKAWTVYSNQLTTPDDQYLYLSSTAGEATYNFWNSTSPTASVFSISGDTNVNASGQNHIAYCFHSVAGYSSFGSYTGTGATGNKITTGFKPAFVMIKRTDAIGNWFMLDNTRNASDPRNLFLLSNASNAEANLQSTDGVDFVDFDSDGFTILNGGSWDNASGGTYIYMAFADKREAAFWLDQSGNNNDWTNNNMQESDISLDNPTNNFANLPSTGRLTVSYGQYSEGNLRWNNTPASSIYAKTAGWLMSSGKWYWEVMMGGSVSTYLYYNGLIDEGVYQTGTGTPTTMSGLHGIEEDGQFWSNGTNVATYSSFAVNDILQIWFDADTGDLYMGKNNTAFNGGSPVKTGLGACRVFASLAGSGTAFSMYNFGQDSSFAGNKVAQGNVDANGYGDFYYAPPAGYLALCTANLPEPAILDGTKHFDVQLYSHTSSPQVLTMSNASTLDLAWIKSRNAATNNRLIDTIRGVSLSSNSTSAESADSAKYTFSANTLTIADPTGDTNESSNTYVSWLWQAGGTGVTNTDGSITSTVSANPTAGFSIVSYTGTNSATETVGHGLSQAPDMVIVKSRDSAVNFWCVYHSGVDVTAPENYLMRLNTADARLAGSAYFNNTAPTSSVFTIGTSSAINNTDRFIAYCFHSVEGYSKFGSFTGNGNADGPFVYTGFRPAFVIIKKTSTAGSWFMFDNKRNGYNETEPYVLSNASNVEATDLGWDILSNGFKSRNSHADTNASGGTYIYMAFAENPFKYSNAR